MKITKHTHSCLLVKDKGKAFLIDPGIYTFQENALDKNNVGILDFILVTHEHPDHFHIPFVMDLIKKFPNVKIVSNSSIKNILKEEGVQVSTLSNDEIVVEKVNHEKVWGVDPPENVLFHINNKLTHPGDSHHFEQTKEVLALPITAPWGSMTNAVNLALRLKPRVIIPIHDWHLRDEARKSFYTRLTEFFERNGIEFKGVENNEEINL